MINKILERGFIALAAYSYIFALISLILFVVIKNGKFDVVEIRKLLFNNMIFMLVFALLDYFLVYVGMIWFVTHSERLHLC